MNKPIENKPRLLGQVWDKLRLRHYSYRTEQSYITWIKRFIFFHNKQQLDTIEKREIESFLTFLAVKHNVAASTQNQVLCAFLLLNKEVLGRELAWLESMQRTKRPVRLSLVLTTSEVRNLLDHLEERAASLLYGAGLRLMKSGKDRVTILPASLANPLQSHLKK